jgi:HTH-type transcriptional regulator/antitoxin HigA
MSSAVMEDMEYKNLLSETGPEVIRTEEQNRDFLAVLEGLAAKEQVSEAESRMIELLTLLIEDYEKRESPVPQAGPLDIVRHLMEAHGLRQKDLTEEFGTESIVSDVLNGKRELTKDHIRRLSARFGVSPAVFF